MLAATSTASKTISSTRNPWLTTSAETTTANRRSLASRVTVAGPAALVLASLEPLLCEIGQRFDARSTTHERDRALAFRSAEPGVEANELYRETSDADR